MEIRYKETVLEGDRVLRSVDRNGFLGYTRIDPYDHHTSAIDREKEFNHWNQRKKLELVKCTNYEFKDLFNDWFEEDQGI